VGTTNVKPFWILMKQEVMGWRWHQLDNMQHLITHICRSDALPDIQPSVRTLKASRVLMIKVYSADANDTVVLKGECG